MKPYVAPHATRALCLRIEPVSGDIVRVTRYPKALTMSNGQTYQSGSGYDFTGYSATTGMSASAIDLAGILGWAGITADKVATGHFDNARCYLFACDYTAPVEDAEPIVASVLGKAHLTDDGYRFEEMALVDLLNQSVGRTYKAQCDKVFGGREYAGCGIDLAAITVSGTLTSVTDATTFTDSARTEDDDWFAYGTIRFTSGANAGLRAFDIRSYSAGQVVTFEPFPSAPAAGDAYVMVPGCRKRLADCQTKWNNVDNFGGFPYIPTASQYGQIGSR